MLIFDCSCAEFHQFGTLKRKNPWKLCEKFLQKCLRFIKIKASFGEKQQITTISSSRKCLKVNSINQMIRSDVSLLYSVWIFYINIPTMEKFPTQMFTFDLNNDVITLFQLIFSTGTS